MPAHAEGMRGQQWFLDAMKAEQMWQISTGKGVTVALSTPECKLTTLI